MASNTQTVQLRDLFKKGKFKDIMDRVRNTDSTDELKQGFEPDQSLPLHYASARGYLDAVRLLIQTHKCDPEHQNVYGITALHCASYCGRIEVVKYLVRNKCDPSLVDEKGACPIVYSTYCTVKRARLDSPLDHYRNVTPSKKHLQIARFLLNHRSKGICGKHFNPKLLRALMLPLHCDSFDDLKDLTKVLKLSEECASKEHSFEVYKCLQLAVDESKWDFVKHILYSYPRLIKVAMAAQISKCAPRHADINNDGWSGWEGQHIYRPYVSQADTKLSWQSIPIRSDKYEKRLESEKLPSYITPFHKVCMYMYDNTDLIKVFLELGICKPDVMSLQIVISRCLHGLAKYLMENSDHAIIMDKYDRWSSLLSHVFESSKYPGVCYDRNIVKLIVEMCSDSRDIEGNTPLHLACQYSVTFIVKEYCNCDHQTLQNNSGKLPLHLACQYSGPEVINIVSSHPNLAVNATDLDGNTPFHIVCSSMFSNNDKSWNESSILKCVNYFTAQKSSNISIQNKQGETPVHVLLKVRERCQPHKWDDSMWEELMNMVCGGQKCFDVNVQDEDGNTPLHIACRIGKLAIIKLLILNFNCNLNLVNKDGCLPLHYAATSLEAVKIISDGCTILHSVNNSGMTPLHIACKEAQLDVVKFLIFERKCLQNLGDEAGINNNLCIHLACQYESDINLLKVLVNNQNVNYVYDGNYQDFQGKAPILVACAYQNLLAVKFLIESKCDLSCKDLHGMYTIHLACSRSLKCLLPISQRLNTNDINICDENGDTPLHLALRSKKLDVVEYLLLNYSCDLAMKNKKGELPLHLVCSANENIAVLLMIEKQCKLDNCNCQTMNGDTPLHLACRAGALSIAQHLVQQYDCTPSLTLKNSRGWFPLDYACKHSFEMVQLVSKPCTVEHLVMQRSTLIKDSSSEPDSSALLPTTLDIACFYGILDIVKFLIKEKSCTLSALGNSQTALMYSCGLLQVDDVNNRFGHPKIVEFLISQCGYDPTLSIDNESVIKLVCEQKQLDVMKALIVMSPDISDSKGNTPLHYACQYDCILIINLLIERKCDQTRVNKERELALHKACCHSLEIVQLVSNCNVNSQNVYGDTPLHLACENNKCDIVKHLIEVRKCDINIPNGKGELGIHIACRQSQELVKLLYGSNINHQDSSGNTPLHIACSSRNYELLNYFLQAQSCRADIPNNVKDLALHTLMKAVFVKEKHESSIKESNVKHQLLNILEALTKRNSDATVFANNEGITPTDIAIMTGEIKLLEIFFRSKEFDTEAKNKFLYVACEYKQSQIIQWFIDHGANFESYQQLGKALDVCQQYKDGNTILHMAFQKGCDHSGLICNVLKYASDFASAFSIQNDEGDTPLHVLAANSREVSSDSEVLSLIKLYCSYCNVRNTNGDTPLHLACQHESSTEFLKLLTTSENINMQNNAGNTPLHIACLFGNIHFSLYLITELNCSLLTLNNDGNSPFHLLLISDSEKTMRRLASLGYFHEHSHIKNVLKYIPDSIINKSNKKGHTILHLACKNHIIFDLPEIVSLLVKSLKCNINVTDDSGATPLHYACSRKLTEVVKLISKCSPNAQLNHLDLENLNSWKYRNFVLYDTALHVACREGKVSIVKHLLKAGHKEALNIFNELKELPFHIACSHTEAAMAGLFIPYKGCFDCNASNASGDTALHIVCRKEVSISDFVPLLVDRMKCRIDVTNGDRNLPLHVACQHNKLSKRMLQILSIGLNGDQVSQQNTQGNTALHELLIIAHDKRPMKYAYVLELVQFIAQKMPNLAICNNDGQQPIHLACHRHRLSMVKYLFESYTSQSLEIPPTVLHAACLNEREGVLSYILENYGIDANASNGNGDLPLHIAMREKRSINSIFLLLKNTTDINSTNCNGNTPLHELCHGSRFHGYKRLKVLNTLLSIQNIHVSVQNMKGQTALHVICETEKIEHNHYGMATAQLSNSITREEYDKFLTNSEEYHYKCIDVLCLSGAELSLKDNDSQTPLTLTKDPEVIKILLKHGADPQPLYDMHNAFFKKYSCEKPPQTPVKLLVIGDPSVGKTTLIESLQKEKSLQDRFSTKEPPRTAGIVSTHFSSEIYGDVTFFDFAGQREYYASHDTFIHHYVKDVPPIIIVLVNLSESNTKILNQTQYWINFMANSCVALSDEAHLVIVCSHADVFIEAHPNRKPLDKIQKLRPSIESQLDDKKIDFQGIIPLNCKVSDTNMEYLRDILRISTAALRVEGVMKFSLHCFYVLLLQTFQDKPVITLKEVTDLLNQSPKDFKENPLSLLQSDDTNAAHVIQFCRDLNENGQIMFIEHPGDTKESWLVLDSKKLLGSKFLGSLFAPTTFPQHCPLSYSTGVVPLSLFEKRFSTSEWHSYTATMLLTFLTRLECCREITDKNVIKSIVQQEDYSEAERYFFFPNLVSIDSPQVKWNPDSSCSVKCGWLIQCTKQGEFFNPHFIQALLLRLIFLFTPGPKNIAYDANDYDSDSEDDDEKENQAMAIVIKRVCSVWKSGIYWQGIGCVKTFIDIIDTRTLTLLMQCPHNSEAQLLKQCSQIISMVLKAKYEFCRDANLLEYFIHPQFVTAYNPLLKLNKRQLFSIPCIIQHIIVNQEQNVRNDHDASVSLEDLMYFEPYCELSIDVIKDLFDKAKSYEQVTDGFLLTIARQLSHRYVLFCHLYHRSTPHRGSVAQSESEDDIISKLVHIFKQRLSLAERTFHNLHLLFDQISIFRGRQPLQGMYSKENFSLAS